MVSCAIFRWQYVLDARDWQQQFPRVDRRLTKRHVDLSRYSKMNVRTAIDVVSEPIETILIEEIDAFGSSSK